MEQQSNQFRCHRLINRQDWGLTWNVAREKGGLLVSKEVNLEFHLELIKNRERCQTESSYTK